MTRTAPLVGIQDVLDVLHGATSPIPRERFDWADVVTDWHDDGQLDVRESRTLAWVLAWGAAVETAHHPPRVGFWPTVAAVLRERALVSVTQQFPVRLSFLSPLAALATADRVPDAALELVISAVPAAELEPIEAESYDDLVAARARNPAEVAHEELPNLLGAEAGDPLGPRACLDVVHGLTSPIAEQRREWAGTVTQRVEAGRFDDDEAATIGTILAWAVQGEHGDARVALLTALAALTSRDRVPPWALGQVVVRLSDSGLDESGRALRSRPGTALEAHRERIRRDPSPPFGTEREPGPRR